MGVDESLVGRGGKGLESKIDEMPFYGLYLSSNIPRAEK